MTDRELRNRHAEHQNPKERRADPHDQVPIGQVLFNAAICESCGFPIDAQYQCRCSGR